MARKVLEQARLVNFSLADFRLQRSHEHSETRIARGWIATYADGDVGRDNNIRAYANRNINGATAGLVCNLNVNANQISAHGAPVNDNGGNPMPVGSTEYNQVTAHGAGAGFVVHDLTGAAGQLTLARAKTYDLDPRTDGAA